MQRIVWSCNAMQCSAMQGNAMQQIKATIWYIESNAAEYTVALWCIVYVYKFWNTYAILLKLSQWQTLHQLLQLWHLQFHTWAWLPWSSAKGISSWSKWINGWMVSVKPAEQSTCFLLPKIALSLGYLKFDEKMHHFPRQKMAIWIHLGGTLLQMRTDRGCL